MLFCSYHTPPYTCVFGLFFLAHIHVWVLLERLIGHVSLASILPLSLWTCLKLNSASFCASAVLLTLTYAPYSVTPSPLAGVCSLFMWHIFTQYASPDLLGPLFSSRWEGGNKNILRQLRIGNIGDNHTNLNELLEGQLYKPSNQF